MLPSGERPAVRIAIQTTLDDIPDGIECLIEGHTTEKTMFEKRLELEGVLFEFPQMPGYRCTTDGLHYFSDEGLLEAYRAAAAYFEKSGPEDAVEGMRERIIFLRRQIESHSYPA